MKWEVYGVDNLYKGQSPSNQANREYKFYKADLTDNIRTFEIFHEIQPDYVIQGAAHIFGVGGFNAHCAEILGQDIAIHNNVLTACAKNGVKRIVFISSSMVYETVTYPISYENDIDLFEAPKTDYGLSKYVNERLTKAFQKQYGLDYVIWRPFNIITPYESSYGDIGTSHVFADFIERIVVDKETELPIIGDGNQVRCFTWIEDVSEVITKYSFLPSTKNQIYNIGNSEPVSMIELAKLIFDISNELLYSTDRELTFKTVKDFPNDVKNRIPGVEKLKSLGWEAKVKLRESVRRCIVHKIRTMKW